ncbi:MAG: hypothetical protein AAF039_07750 [Bacteroidota bacterium]
MKKDIEIPIAKDVYIALVHEWNDEFLSKDWNAYIINDKPTPIEMVLVVSKGFDGEIRTSTLRYAFASISAKGFEKIEMVQEEVLRLTNEFFVTYYADNKLYEKRFLFEKNGATEQNMVPIPLLETDGILAK